MLKYLLFFLIVGFVSVKADKSVTVGEITTRVLGQSGKITVFKGANESGGVTITFDEISEKTESGAVINEHTLKTFASQNFVFSNQTTTTYQDSGLNVTQFSFSANISDSATTLKATITVYVYIFTEPGIIVVDDQNETVKSGDMKFTVFIQNWPFCGMPGISCKQGQNGSYLEFAIEIKGKNAPQNITAGKKYSLGDGATVLLSNQVMYDNSVLKKMYAGYPSVMTQGTKSIFVFRFEKFNSSAKNDPVISLTGENTSLTTTPVPTIQPTADPGVEHSGVYARVKGKSGKIEIGSTDNKNSNKITVSFRKIEEISTSNNKIQDNSHTFNTFANQDFNVSQPTIAKYPNSSLDVNCITFVSTLTNSATIKIYLYVFISAGTIYNGNETAEVKAGNIKFNMEINGWSFCNESNCQPAEVGNNLDMEIEIGAALKEHKKQEKRVSTEGDRYDIGSGTIVLSTTVNIDGNFTGMTPGYPMLNTTGVNAVYKFRFPKFKKRLVYDPIIDFTLKVSSASRPTSIQMTVAAVMSCMIVKSLL